MKVIDEDELDRHRGPGRCEVCGKPVGNRDAHHVRARGLAGGSRVDVPWNLLAACRTCHTRLHYSGKPSRAELLAIVARREGVSVEEIEDEINLILRTPKP